jgi:putative FmdB family regulatory protein
MPLYEYQCDACGRRFEVIQKFSDTPVEVCPTCGGSVKRLLSSPAIQFKGSGWYITDYARAAKTDGGAASQKTEGKTEAAAATSASESGGKSASESTSASPASAKSE